MATTQEILKQVRKIEIKTKGLSQNIFAGEYHSAFKGLGMTFSEVREYQFGDDVRNIDWNVTARHDAPFVKVFEEERELTSMLLIDVSPSEAFGTHKQFKNLQTTLIAATIAFSAIQNNDKVGVLFFSDKVEKFIPPKKGRKHILRIVKELIDFQPEGSGTDITEALVYLNKYIKKRAAVFLISDFIDEGFEDALKITARKHDLAAVRVYDRMEVTLPNVGFVKFKDLETGIYRWLDTGNKTNRNNYSRYWREKRQELLNIFKRSGISYTEISNDEDYVRPLMRLFEMKKVPV